VGERYEALVEMVVVIFVAGSCRQNGVFSAQPVLYGTYGVVNAPGSSTETDTSIESLANPGPRTPILTYVDWELSRCSQAVVSIILLTELLNWLPIWECRAKPLFHSAPGETPCAGS
jgi:hypothetical protein